MKSYTKQRGSIVHIAIVIILVIAILGVLGFIFWHNFLDKKTTTPTTAQSTSTTQTADTKTLVASQTLDGYTLTFNYPSTWKKTDKGFEDPDSTVLVNIALSDPDGLGGTCDTESASVTDPLAQIAWESLPNNSNAIFTDYIGKFAATNQYFYGFSLQPSDRAEVKTAKVGDSTCVTFSAVSGYVFLNNDANTALQGSVQFPALMQADGSGTNRTDLSLKEIQAAFATDAAKQAKDMLLSVKVTQ
jgi:hypothetical protein